MILPQVTCNFCKSRFYFDVDNEDDQEYVVNDLYVCSHCLRRLKKCSICNKLEISSREIKINDGICKECKIIYGSYPNKYLSLRFKCFERDEFKCTYCGRSSIEHKIVLHCDHIIPKSKFGEDSLENLTTSCSECNVGKLDIMLSEYNLARIKLKNMGGINL